MSDISSYLERNKKLAPLYIRALVDGLECEESPIHLLNGNDRLFDYICYLSLPRWKQDQMGNDRPELPGGK